MAWNRKTNTRVSSKNVIANPVGVKQSIAVLSFTLFLAACGGDSSSGAKGPDSAEGADDGREVATLVDMGRCTSEREGDTVYVAEKLTDYLCKNNSWVDLSEVSSDMSSGKADSNTTSSSSKGTGSTDETDPSSSDSDTDVPEGFVRENISVTGVAQKGPFKFGSPLNLYELKKNLTPSGTVYKDEISSNKGDFVIPKVSLAYPYAKLEVRGLYRNEVTGEWSTDSMTLRALTDFSEERTDVNINLLTHLEYDRALYLVQEKGYSIYAAKKQAAQEIMTAFEFATAVTYSEDFAIFQNEGVSVTTSAGNATLLAISALVMGNRSDAEIQNTIDKFIADIKTDGEWNDLQTKASMADWAYDFNYSTIKASVKSWNILDIPAYETYLDIYWNNVYGLGGCSVNRKDVVAPNSNKLSKNYNKYFICNGSQWDSATTFQKDTYEWATGKTGEFKKGNVTDSIYVYNGTKWEVSERETAIGLCGTSNAGVVSKFNGTYYICKNKAWTTATTLEYDTYGLKGVEGDVKAGVVNKDMYYVYENGAWRVATSEIENNFGACIASRESEKHSLNDKYYVCESKKWFQISAEEFELGYCSTTNAGVVSKSNNVYYICRDNAWKTATPLEYDTYGWKEGIVGEVKKGDITSAYYVYRNNKWNEANSVEQALGSCTTENTGVVKTIGNSYYTCKSSSWTSSTTVERSLGSCTSDNSGTVDKVNSTYYICKNNAWKTATTTEADFYGVSCSKDGAIVNGSVNTAKKYVCDDGTFRSATNDEITLNLGCTSYTRYKIDTVSISHNSIEKWVCGKKWVYGKIVWGEDLIDSRDNKKYKTVIIDTMTWMAENLNYNYYESGNAKSFCYKNSADSCEKYGRLYTWSAAMDSAAVFSESGKGCTANTSVCIPSVNGHVRGVCPEGWHLPSNKEWNFLKSIAKESYGVANASQSEYVSVLKASVKDWETSYSYATDAFGFAVLPAYYGSVSGYNSGCGFTKGRAAFWSYISHKDGGSDYTEALGFDDYEFFGTYFGGTCEMSVRCMKD